MRTIRLIFVAVCCSAAMSFTSCGDKETGYESGPIEMSLFFQDSEETVREVEISQPRTAIISLKAAVDKVSGQNVTAVIAADPSKVEKYNEANQTDHEFVPASAFSFDLEEFIFPRYNKSSSVVRLTLKSAELTDDKEYLLPIIIKEVKGDDNISVDKESVMYVKFKRKYVEPPQLITATETADKWEVLFASSEVVDGSWGLSQFLVDGNPESYWHHNYKITDPPPFELIIDTKRMIDIYGLRLRARTLPGQPDVIQNTGVISQMRVSVAETITLPVNSVSDIKEVEWKGMTSFDSNTLFWQVYNNPYLDDITRGRYIRITILKSYSQGKPDAYNGACTSEIDVWGLPVNP